MADTKTTVEMQSPPEWAIALTQEVGAVSTAVADGFVQVETRVYCNQRYGLSL